MSLNFYVDNSIDQIKSMINTNQSLSQNLKRFFSSSFGVRDNPILRNGCLLTNSLLELHENEESLYKETTKLYEKVREVKYELFSYYIGQEKIRTDYNACELTDYYMTFWQGLKVQSRNTESEKKSTCK